MANDRGVTFLVRHIPAELHAAARQRAQRQGRSLTWVLIELLRRWIQGEIRL